MKYLGILLILLGVNVIAQDKGVWTDPSLAKQLQDYHLQLLSTTSKQNQETQVTQGMQHLVKARYLQLELFLIQHQVFQLLAQRNKLVQ